MRFVYAGMGILAILAGSLVLAFAPTIYVVDYSTFYRMATLAAGGLLFVGAAMLIISLLPARVKTSGERP